ncbi:DNA gyrase subunit A [Pelobium manganitolerans]|uniref:DNA gyrase subunit A n=1 Tax=Pelobium manganitolerans TaxID=1842495 RepID=UPI003FA392F4
MRTSEEREILRKIREEEALNIMDFTDDDTSIQVVIKKINPDMSFTLKYLKNFKTEMTMLERDIATIRNDIDKKTFLETMKVLLSESELLAQQKKTKQRSPGDFTLKHSVTWYLYNRLDSEIDKMDFKIEGVQSQIKAVDNLDIVIKTIRNSLTQEEAVNKLIEQIMFTEIEAQYIVNMSLRRLTGIEKDKVYEEINYLNLIRSLLIGLKQYKSAVNFEK